MAGLTELAAVMMDAAQRRLEITANNIGNLNTPGFRAKRAFQRVVDARQALPVLDTAFAHRPAQSVLKNTGNPLDVALSGRATLLLREGDRLIASATAQLRRDGEGRLADDAGRLLQAAGGGDLVIGQGATVFLRDGVVLVNGQPEARIGMFAGNPAEFGTGGLPVDGFPDIAEDAVLHQGMVIPSDVDLAAEMVDMTAAGRTAESGAKIFQLADELLGKASSTLGEIRR
jgi:flagellar basal-body rod protein FlgF